ncbi:MAG TPA: XdhC family protein [Blastocatellia bacterium]|nr:XdhC family protein [Blastocatellia bacterium]
MSTDYFAKLLEMNTKREPFAVATVIETEGSASARPGSKAIIDSKGITVFGWVGGGCAESAVCHAAVQSFEDAQTRILVIDLNDEVLGAGMPCGGMMKVFVEPVLPKPELVITGHGRIAQALAEIGRTMDFYITVSDPAANRETFPAADRIDQEGPGYGNLRFGPNSYVVIATQHKGDHLSMKQAVEGGSAYIALIASKKRAALVLDYLLATGVPRESLDRARVRTPAGLDIGASTPEEIALSIISEMVAVRRGGSGRPMMEVKAVEFGDSPEDAETINETLSTCAPISIKGGPDWSR